MRKDVFLFTQIHLVYKLIEMCDYHKNIANPLYGKRPNEYKRRIVPCNNCKSCFKDRSDEWAIRLHYHLKTAVSAYFVTLTYALPRHTKNGLYTVHTDDLQNYFKRLRKREKENTLINYYAVAEYGTKHQRPHYHAIIFNVGEKRNIYESWSVYNNPIGSVDVVDNVNEAMINYVTSYIGKRIGIPLTDDDDRQKEFSLMSKGMGKYYVDICSSFNKDNKVGYTVLDGKKYKLPRYYKNLIWPDYKKRFQTKSGNFVDVKCTNPIKKQISKQNYENFIKSENLNEKLAGGVLPYRKAKHHNAEIKNKIKSTTCKGSF